MKQATFFPVVLLASAIAPPAFAEAPRIITLQGASQETALPGAQDGAKHGVTVRRGAGFPDPIVIEAPAQVVEKTPKRTTRKAKKSKRGGW